MFRKGTYRNAYVNVHHVSLRQTPRPPERSCDLGPDLEVHTPAFWSSDGRHNTIEAFSVSVVVSAKQIRKESRHFQAWNGRGPPSCSDKGEGASMPWAVPQPHHTQTTTRHHRECSRALRQCHGKEHAERPPTPGTAHHRDRVFALQGRDTNAVTLSFWTTAHFSPRLKCFTSVISIIVTLVQT